MGANYALIMGQTSVRFPNKCSPILDRTCYPERMTRKRMRAWRRRPNESSCACEFGVLLTVRYAKLRVHYACVVSRVQNCFLVHYAQEKSCV